MDTATIPTPSSSPPGPFSRLTVLVDTRELADRIELAKRCLPAQSSLPILNCVLLSASDDRLEITTNDLTVVYQQSMAAECQSPGRAVVDVRRLHALLQKIKGDGRTVLIGHEDSSLLLEAGGVIYTFEGLPAQEYPEIPEIPTEGERVLRISETRLRDLVAKLGPFRSTVKTPTWGNTSTHQLVQGLLLTAQGGQLRLRATDRIRLLEATVQEIEDEDWGAILPSDVVARLLTVLPKKSDQTCALLVNPVSHQIRFQLSSGAVLQSQLLEGAYPEFGNVLRVIKENPVRATSTFSRTEMQRVVRRLLAAFDTPSSAGHKLRLTFSPSTLGLSVRGDKVKAMAAVPASCTFPEYTTATPGPGDQVQHERHRETEESWGTQALDADYLLSFLEALTGDEVTWKWTSNSAPVVLTTEADTDLVAIVMPIDSVG